MAGRRLKIGELARLTGKSARALHLYEELGLLHPEERSKGGFRLYASEAVTRVQWISYLNDLGFSLSEIKSLRSDWSGSDSGPHAMGDLKRLYQEKLAEAREQIGKLTKLTAELEQSLSWLETCATACDGHTHTVQSCSKCDVGETDRSASSPALVAGFYKG